MWSALGPGGHLGVPLKDRPDFGDLVSEFVCKIIVRSAFLALATAEAGETGETGETEVVSKTVARTPLPTRTPGARMTVVTLTPSN